MKTNTIYNGVILVLNVSVFCCMIFVIAGKEWFIFEENGPTETKLIVKVGLWKQCLVQERFHCTDINIGKDLNWLSVARGLVISSCIVSIFSILSTLAGYWRLVGQKFSVLLSFITIFNMAGTLSTFFHHHKSMLPEGREVRYGWTFIVGVVVVLQSFLSAILGLYNCVYIQNQRVRRIKYFVQEDFTEVPLATVADEDV